MHISSVLKILGVLLMVFSFTMIPPAAIAIYYDDGGQLPFLTAFGSILLLGIFMWLPFFRNRDDLGIRDGFLVVVLFWAVLGSIGSVPFLLSDAIHLSVTDAVFESISGLTTTGATVITGLDTLPKSLLFYRQQLQWLGGMGIIVLAVAILPMLGIGGMQLYKAETPGPLKDSKLTPRITETAKALWYLYLSLTIVCALAYFAAGMDWFDAIGHAFSTIAIGGFSTHDASIGYFNNPTIEIVCSFFMFFSAINFALHFSAFRKGHFAVYRSDPEVRFFIGLLFCAAVFVCVSLWLNDTYDNWQDTVRQGAFETISIFTTTGFGTTDFAGWPGSLPFLLIFLSFVGGCAGSTAGGMKVVRALLVARQGLSELRRLIHPHAIIPVKLGQRAVPDRVLNAVWGFASVYMFVFIVIIIALTSTGMDFVTSYSAAAACLNNLGPGLGEVASHYGDISSTAKWILCFAMLLGRLEVFTLLVLFIPMFWRH